MPIFNDTYCQICDRFYTKERWNKHLYSSRHLHRDVNGYWPAFFPQRKLTRDEGLRLEQAFWDVIYCSVDDLGLFDFLKMYFRMCTNITDHVPIRSWDDVLGYGGLEEQWGYDYRDDMIAQFEQVLYNKNFTLQDRGKDNPIDTLENRIKFWVKVIDNGLGPPIPENLYDYDYNDKRLDGSICGSHRKELEKLLDILRSK